ncbi:hypothetical protein DPMN_032702 [Dreissena polymorpha]|uniref:Uncharacterized protein n=1 Tax=Dreissena polymorpha TaxID=45954 RepID=A0A9D4RJ60_DREPO|nr:hypothetical protein DPMN_032702 [Dreissena polymorpha]
MVIVQQCRLRSSLRLNNPHNQLHILDIQKCIHIRSHNNLHLTVASLQLILVDCQRPQN